MPQLSNINNNISANNIQKTPKTRVFSTHVPYKTTITKPYSSPFNALNPAFKAYALIQGGSDPNEQTTKQCEHVYSCWIIMAKEIAPC